jgi:hypothetical protein
MSADHLTMQPDDAAPAGTLDALAMLFSDLETSADALRELLQKTDNPTALTEVVADALALMCWRCDFGRKLAGSTAVPLDTTEERFIRADVLRRGGAA